MEGGSEPQTTAARRLQTLVGHMVQQLSLCPTAGTSGSLWEQVPEAPPDAIIGITEAWKADSDPRKLNLGVGAYRTEEGKPLVLNVVRKAEAAITADPAANKEYLPISGNAEFCRLSRALALGESSAAVHEGRVATVQSLSGTGALRLGGEFLAGHHPGPKIILLPTPTWGNHKSVFERSGLKTQQYRYFDAATRGLDLQGLLEDLRSAPRSAVVLLHACAHNPTGVDPSTEQWRNILAVVQERGLLPFFDMAYQGFASGDLDTDAAAVRLFAGAGLELLLAQSYAKNLGLYGERVGALNVVCGSKDAAKRVESQLKIVIRSNYSNPPLHGAAIAAKVLGDPQLFREWKVELRGMAERIHAMRRVLYGELTQRGAPGDWRFVLNQIGMFSYTGLSLAQCRHLTSAWHVYLTMDGRVSMAGLSEARAGYLADAIIDALRTCPA